ncbi:hypothetical protein F511_11849 [Dorcoceras hygrometricum]|uniref:H/ACA ribonucleoprotein complex non-core subunit NAF1 n=1 Tax=Dorcoceras hygrometricum TaxID=472368 RepID=A0A2Z7BGS6_9LAMI|nr:hypothetical protein F511_11849 [Dorcoceras hygrometricum]
MVGCFNNPTAEEADRTKCFKNQSLSSDIKKPPSPKDPLDLCLPELEDIPASFSDSFLDFDSINSWFVEGNPDIDSFQKLADSGSDKGEFMAAVVGMGGDKVGENDLAGVELSGGVSGPEKCETGGVSRSEETGVGLVDRNVIDEGVLNRGEQCGNSMDLGCSIDERMGKVSLDEELNASIISRSVDNASGETRGVNNVYNGGGQNSGERLIGGISDATDGGVTGVKSHEAVNDKGGNICDDSESEDESSSSSSSSSSSDDEDEHEEDSGHMAGGRTSKSKERRAVDVEEGEILLSDVDEIVGWSDNENDEDGGVGTAGPIKSKNELKILPPVPSITVTLQPHHQTVPVGIILSIIGVQVIVEGIEKHNPLNEGSILWITESRSPLGIVDEIFGPVKNPYYVVRYNFESEVPSNIQQGTSISFVSDFANHVLNDKSLYQKGYDASGENDEELSDELEFSDDEKEAEYKKMHKMKKRGTSESKPGTKQKDRRQFKAQLGNGKSHPVPSAKTPNFGDNLPIAESLNHGSSAGLGLAFTANQAIVPSLPFQTPIPGFCAPNGIWGNGFLGQQPLNIGDLSGVPAAANFMQWMHQHQQPYQFHQMPPVRNSIPGFPINFSSSVDQPNFSGVPAFTPLLGLPNQNVFNQSSTGMGSQTPLSQNMVELVFQSDGSQVSNSLQPSPMNSGNPQNFNRSNGGGRRGHHRGGGGRRGYHSGGRSGHHRSGRHHRDERRGY